MAKQNQQIILAYYKSCRLPSCETEYKFHPTRKWRFDYAFPFVKVAVEQQGGVWSCGKHGRGSGIIKDYEKMNEAQLHGWIVLQILPNKMAMLETVKLIRRAIEMRMKWQ